MAIEKSPINNHPIQRLIWNDPARFKVFVGGRRIGKSFLVREKLCERSEVYDSLNVYVAPTRYQAKSIMWTQLKDRIRQLGWRCKINESELKITRPNKAVIQLASAEKPSRLRGLGINFIAFDEIADYRTSEIWHQVVRPALSDKLGEAWFISTPKGFGHFYDLYNYSKTEPNWANFQYRTCDSPFFQTDEGRAELEEAKRNLSERDYRQEFEASFENFSGRVYGSFDRVLHDTVYNYNLNLPVTIGMDFNRSPMTAAVFQEYKNKDQKALYQIAEIFLQSSDTPEICREIIKRYPKSKVTVIPDATGSRTYSVNKGLSDHIILRQYGFTVTCGASNPSRIDRWSSVNRCFEKGLVKINVKNCPRTVKDLEVICFKEGSCEPMLTDPMLGHISDAHGYAAHYTFPIMSKIVSRRYA